jgi:hypothetical protein
MEIADIRARADYCFRRAAVTSHPEMRGLWKTAAEAWEAAAYRIGQPNEVTQLSCGRGADRATLLEVVEGSMNIDGQYDRDTGAMLFQLHRYIETWIGPRCPEYEGGCAVCYMWAIYDKLAKYTQ